MITLWLLRQIEQKLTVQIGKWEEEHERSFLINGCHYMNIINNQWAAFNAQKEQEKVERVSNKPGTKTNRPAMHTEGYSFINRPRCRCTFCACTLDAYSEVFNIYYQLMLHTDIRNRINYDL